MKKSILLLFSLCLMLQVLAQKKGYIIKIDGETIYTDLGSSFVQVGDWINVYGKGTYIVHPVTQKKIYTEPEIIGKLEIGSTFKDYSIAKVNDRSLLHLLTYIIHSGFISGYQNRYGDNLKPPTNVYHRMTA